MPIWTKRTTLLLLLAVAAGTRAAEPSAALLTRPPAVIEPALAREHTEEARLARPARTATRRTL